MSTPTFPNHKSKIYAGHPAQSTNLPGVSHKGKEPQETKSTHNIANQSITPTSSKPPPTVSVGKPKGSLKHPPSFPVELATIKAVATQTKRNITKIHHRLPTKTQDVQWLQSQKKWSLRQIKELQNVQPENKSEEIATHINETIHLHHEFIQSIDLHLMRPPIVATKIDESFSKWISRIFNECIKTLVDLLYVPAQPKPLLEKINSLMGIHKEISDEEFRIFERLTTDLKDNFQQYLNFEQTHESPQHFLNSCLNEMSVVRSRQLKLLKSGKTIESDQELKNKIDNLNIKWNILTKYIAHEQKITDQNKNVYTGLFQTIAESAFRINIQFLSESSYPDCVAFEDSKPVPNLPDTEKRERNLIQKDKPFRSRNEKLLQKAEWENVKTRGDGVFESGFRKITFQTHDGHQIETGAHLDLKPLLPLTREQVYKIFEIIKNFIDDPLLDPSKMSDTDLNKLFDPGQQLLPKNLDLLRTKILEFTQRIESGMALALLTIGHEPSPYETLFDKMDFLLGPDQQFSRKTLENLFNYPKIDEAFRNYLQHQSEIPQKQSFYDYFNHFITDLTQLRKEQLETSALGNTLEKLSDGTPVASIQKKVDALQTFFNPNTPPLGFSKQKTNEIRKLIGTLAENVNLKPAASEVDRPVKVAQQINRQDEILAGKIKALMGEYLTPSPEEVVSLFGILNEPRLIEILEQFPPRNSKTTPLETLSRLIDQLTAIRSHQLKLLQSGQNALLPTEKVNGIEIQTTINELMAFQMVLSQFSGESEQKFEKQVSLISNMINSASVQNFQILTDAFCPKVFLNDKMIKKTLEGEVSILTLSTEKRSEKNKEGFYKPNNHANYSVRTEWTENNFIQGKRRIQFQTPTTPKRTLTAEVNFDLNPLVEHGSLLMDQQILRIYDYAHSYSKKAIDDPEKQPEAIHKELEEQLKKINLTNKQQIQLKKIVETFYQQAINVIVESTLTIGH